MSQWNLGCGVFVTLLTGLATVGRSEAQDQFFESGGVRIRYVVSSNESGEPIVFVNGFTERLEVWSDVVASDSLKEYRVIRFDTRGLGLSDKPNETAKYGREMAQDVLRLLDHLKIEKAHVVGYSMGAWITLRLVADHPERIITATLGGSGGLHPSQVERNLIIADAVEGKDISAAVSKLTLPNGATISEEAARETVLALGAVGRDYAATFDAKAIAAMMRAFGELVVPVDKLKGNKVPVLVLYSNENDAGRPLAGEVTALKDRMPKVTLVKIDGANHGNARSKVQFAESLAKFIADDGTSRRGRGQ